jgi:putative nucleotidyltransferase with HDIG domain
VTATGAGAVRTVLVVDDDEGSRSYLAAAFEGLGCRVVQAADGGEALAILTRSDPDLVCTDLMMPGLDGLEFAGLVRSHAPGLPLLLVSACDLAEVEAQARQAGVLEFLRKPVGLGELRRVLARVLSRVEPGPEGPTPPPTGALEGLDAGLLRKTTQLCLLTQLTVALRPDAQPDIERLLVRSLEFILRAVGGQRAAVALAEEGAVQPLATWGAGSERLPLEGLHRRLREAAEPSQPWFGAVAGEPLLAAPLRIQGASAGFVCVGRGSEGPAFTWSEAGLLAACSGQLAVALENACLGRQLTRSFQETVSTLVVALEARHKYTEGHSLRVAEHAALLAGVLGLPRAACEQTRIAALLHDLGKVGVHDAILDKPSRLTPGEWAIMRRHPGLGARILGSLGFLAEESRIVLHHHERPDGTGYPDGLSGESIPLASRIIAVADAFDAMRSLRSYRPVLPLEVAMAELRRGAGPQFDALLVEAFCDAVA